MTTTVLQEPTELHKAFEAFIKADFAKEIFPCRDTKYYSSDSIDILLYRAFTSGAYFKGNQVAELTKDAEPISTNFIQTVPDKCDRIVWRGDYFHLPPKISHINFPTNSMEQEFANYERRGYEKGLAAANTNPPAPNQAQWQPIDTAPATPAAILLLTTSRTMKIETGHWARNMVYSSKADGDDCFYTHWMPLPTPPIDEAKDKP